MKRSTAYAVAQKLRKTATANVEVYKKAGYWPNQWTVRADFGDEVFHCQELYEAHQLFDLIKKETTR